MLRVAILVALSGCLTRPPWGTFQTGVNARRVASHTPPAVAARTVDEPIDESPSGTAGTVTFRFAQTLIYNMFAGADAEAGTLGTAGSNFGALSAVAGTQHDIGFLSLSAELAGGRRWLRYSLKQESEGSWFVEPRVRGDFWIGNAVTLGAAVGAPLDGGFVAGIYLGIHDAHSRD